jgi:hypothetical protein
VKWRFAEGTVVHLGGNVEGDSPWADELRRTVVAARRGWGPTVFMEAQPSDGEPMNVDDPDHVDQWLRDLERCLDMTLAEVPAGYELFDDGVEAGPGPTPDPLIVH